MRHVVEEGTQTVAKELETMNWKLIETQRLMPLFGRDSEEVVFATLVAQELSFVAICSLALCFADDGAGTVDVVKELEAYVTVLTHVTEHECRGA